MKSGRYIEGARNRQNILDYLNEHPGTMAPDIIRALGLDKVIGSDRLGTMYRRGELDREKATFCGINSAGKRFCMGTFAYTALVKTTVGADEMLTRVSENLRDDTAKKEHKNDTVKRKGYYSQKGGSWVANERASGGGQGALRSTFGIQSGLA